MNYYEEYMKHVEKNPSKYEEIDAAFDSLTRNINDLSKPIDDDYEYGDEWDWDRNDRSQYCIHGTFIGSWWGPDILCGRCEMGEGSDNNEEDDEF
jgi:hypothetical protein